MQNYLIYKVKPTDTIQSIAKTFQVDQSCITKQNADLQAGDRVVIDMSPKTYHVVTPGDSLDSIAAKYGITTQQILKNNQITRLFIGQRLQI